MLLRGSFATIRTPGQGRKYFECRKLREARPFLDRLRPGLSRGLGQGMRAVARPAMVEAAKLAVLTRAKARSLQDGAFRGFENPLPRTQVRGWHSSTGVRLAQELVFPQPFKPSMPAVSMEERSPSVAKAISTARSDYVRAEAHNFQRLRSVVSGVVVDRVRSYFCSPARDGELRSMRFVANSGWASPSFSAQARRGEPGRRAVQISESIGFAVQVVHRWYGSAWVSKRIGLSSSINYGQWRAIRAKLQVPPLRCPGFPLQLSGVGELREKATSVAPCSIAMKEIRGRSSRDDKVEASGPPWHEWVWMDRVEKKLNWTSRKLTMHG
jgi:hypothetical protein